MKPVFKCEYCDYINTEDNVLEHENICSNNYTKRSCLSCKYKKFKTLKQLECEKGKELKENSYLENCELYEHKETRDYKENLITNIFNTFF